MLALPLLKIRAPPNADRLSLVLIRCVGTAMRESLSTEDIEFRKAHYGLVINHDYNLRP
jgi:hypothetical protein